MYLDASAIVAILGREEDGPELLAKLEAAGPPFYVSPTGLFEAVMGLASKKARQADTTQREKLIDEAAAAISRFVENIGAEQMSVSPSIGWAAVGAARRYSRAVGHPADMNFGDCFAYACAKASGVPMLYKGNDFSQTDLA